MAGAINNSGSGGVFNGNAPDHTYAEEGTFNVTMTVTHHGLAAVGPTQTDTATVGVPPVSVTGVPGTAQEIGEGQSTAGPLLVGTFTDIVNLAGTIDNGALPEY